MIKSGFYNAIQSGGTYDRIYNADDYKNVFAAFIKDGVRRSGLDDLRVTANGLALTVKMGFAICGGRWVHIDADYPLITVTPPVGDYSRRDAVILRVDANENARAASLVYRKGSPSSNPIAPVRDTSTGVTELILATVLVAPSATTVRITDTRADSNNCGWITTPVGYDDYFVSLESQFDTWFNDVKNELASVTLFKQYMWRTVLDSPASSVTFSIPQYDSTGTDILQIYVNGLLEIKGVDYTISGSTITFGTGGGGTGTKIAGTEIVVICYKSIDGTGLGSVSDEITELQNDMALLSDTNDYKYVCNGTNDNVKLSEIAQTWLNGGNDYGCKKISVYGTFGCSAAYGGSGTSANPYRWFSVGLDANTNRKIIFDFSCCGQITIPIARGTVNYIFNGYNAHIIGANVIVNQTGAGTTVKCFSATTGAVCAENCRFWITANKDSVIANTGTFINCRASVANLLNNSYCFLPLDGSLLRIQGGEYYAYTGSSSAQSAVVGQSAANAVSILYGVNAPTSARAGYYQTNSIIQSTGGGTINCTDLVSALAVNVVAGSSNIRGTIAKSKPNLM